MGRIEIGEYLAIVQDGNGRETGRMMIVPRKRFPLKGEAVSVEDKRYRVIDIVHPVEESEQFDRFLYTNLTVYLVLDIPGTAPSRGPRDDEADKPSTSQAPPHLTSVVLPFRAGPIDAASPFLPLLKLLAVAVARGYEEQSYELERLKLACWSLDWSGDGWIANKIADGRTAAELRELSREAKRGQAEADAFCRQLLPVVGVAAEQPMAEVIEIAAFRSR